MNRANAKTVASPVETTWLVLATLCVAAFLSALNYFATSPFYPSMARDLDTTVPLLGQAITLMLVISAVLGLVVGPLADRYGYRWPLVIGVLAIAVNMLGTAVTPSYSILLGLSVVGALGDALVFGLTLALASTLFTGDDRQRALSWTIASASVGAIIGVPILTTIGDFSGWRVAIGVLGIASAAVAWMVMAFLPPDQLRPDSQFRGRELLLAYAPLLKHFSTMRLLAITGLRAMWFIGTVTYLGAYLGDDLGLSTSEVGLVYMIGGGGFTIGSFLAGTRLMGTSPRAAVAVANVAGGFLFGLMLWSSSVAVVLSVLPIASMMAAVGSVGIVALLAVESPIKAGTTMALNASLLNAGGAAGAALGGALIALGGYGAMAIGLPAFALVAAILAWWPKR